MLPRSVHGAATALSASLFDHGRGVPEDRLAFALADVDDFTRRAGWKTRSAFIASLVLLEWIWPLRFGFMRRFSRLEPAKRLVLLERIENSGVAPLLVLPKAMLCLVFFEHPDNLKEIGFDDKPLRALPEPQA